MSPTCVLPPCPLPSGDVPWSWGSPSWPSPEGSCPPPRAARPRPAGGGRRSRAACGTSAGGWSSTACGAGRAGPAGMRSRSWSGAAAGASAAPTGPTPPPTVSTSGCGGRSARPPAPSAPQARRWPRPRLGIPCYGTGSDGYRVQLVYVRLAGSADRSATLFPSFATWAGHHQHRLPGQRGPDGRDPQHPLRHRRRLQPGDRQGRGVVRRHVQLLDLRLGAEGQGLQPVQPQVPHLGRRQHLLRDRRDLHRRQGDHRPRPVEQQLQQRPPGRERRLRPHRQRLLGPDATRSRPTS